MTFRPNPRQVAIDEEITETTLGAVSLAKDLNNKATPLQHIGPENKRLSTHDMDATELLTAILIEMRIMNTHLSLITDEEITENDMEIE